MFPEYVVKWPGTSQYKINYANLVTYRDESRYSSLMPWHLASFNDVLTRYGPRIMDVRKIVDGTAHIGVDTIFLSKYYSYAKMTAVEINPDVCEILRRNLRQQVDWEVYICCSDFLAYMKSIPDVDLVYLDPPWGGPAYRKESNVVLKLGDRLIEDVVADLLKKVKWVVVKAPLNFIPSHTLSDKNKHIVYKLPSNTNDPRDPRRSPSYSLYIMRH